jgi:exonuclease VII small subunit
MDMKKEKKYEEVYAELEALIGRIEDPERDLASIGEDVKKAMEMIRWCRDYVRGSQEETEKLMKEEP